MSGKKAPPFKKGNKAAEKWTKPEAERFMNDSLVILKKNPEIIFIGEVSVKMGTYREIFTYLCDKFPVFLSIKKEIDSIIESRLYSEAAKGNLNATMAIFGLKNNHGWTDKKEVAQDITSGGNELKGTITIIGNDTPT